SAAAFIGWPSGRETSSLQRRNSGLFLESRPSSCKRRSMRRRGRVTCQHRRNYHSSWRSSGSTRRPHTCPRCCDRHCARQTFPATSWSSALVVEAVCQRPASPRLLSLLWYPDVSRQAGELALDLGERSGNGKIATEQALREGFWVREERHDVRAVSPVTPPDCHDLCRSGKKARSLRI